MELAITIFSCLMILATLALWIFMYIENIRKIKNKNNEDAVTYLREKGRKSQRHKTNEEFAVSAYQRMIKGKSSGRFWLWWLWFGTIWNCIAVVVLTYLAFSFKEYMLIPVSLLLLIARAFLWFLTYLNSILEVRLKSYLDENNIPSNA